MVIFALNVLKDLFLIAQILMLKKDYKEFVFYFWTRQKNFYFYKTVFCEIIYIFDWFEGGNGDAVITSMFDKSATRSAK